MRVSRVYPGAATTVDVGHDGAAGSLEGWYPRLSETGSDGHESPSGRPRVRINLVASIDGKASSAGPPVSPLGSKSSSSRPPTPVSTSDSLSSAVDRMILRAVRAAADVVVTGAATVRAEGMVVPRHGTLAVVTRGDDVTTLPRPKSPDDGARLLILCPADAAGAVRGHFAGTGAAVESIDISGDDPIPVRDIVRLLSRRGARDIVCEGGPSLAGAFLEAGLVDELCLTTSPAVSSLDAPLLGRGAITTDRRATLVQLLIDDESYLYARWAFAA